MRKGHGEEQRRKNYVILAENFYLDGKKEKAMEFYKKSLKFQGPREENMEILFNIAIIYDELGMAQESKKSYEEILNIDQDNPGAYYGMAIMEEQMGNTKEALEYYYKAIEKDQDYDRAYYFAANLHDKIGEKEKAIELYKKVIELSPDDYYAYNNLGSLYEEEGNYDLAHHMLEKSIEINPEFFKSLFNMGVVYKKLDNNPMALKFYHRAKEANSKYHYIYLNISAIYIEEGKYNQSIAILSEGIKNNPYAEDLYYNRACCHSILNMEEEAVKDIRKSLTLDPSIITWVKRDKDFYNLYNNKEFKEILREYSLDK